jgi:hypothetical protein
MCENGMPPSCGTSDTCTSRFCDPNSNSCGTSAVSHAINYNYSMGSAGTVTLLCGDTTTTQTYQSICPTGAPFTVSLRCALNSAGGLTALLVSSNINCLSNQSASTVTTGCSVLGAGGPSFSCCF